MDVFSLSVKVSKADATCEHRVTDHRVWPLGRLLPMCHCRDRGCYGSAMDGPSLGSHPTSAGTFLGGWLCPALPGACASRDSPALDSCHLPWVPSIVTGKGVFFSLGSWESLPAHLWVARETHTASSRTTQHCIPCPAATRPLPPAIPDAFRMRQPPDKAPSSLDLCSTKPAACPLCASAPQSKMGRPQGAPASLAGPHWLLRALWPRHTGDTAFSYGTLELPGEGCTTAGQDREHCSSQ